MPLQKNQLLTLRIERLSSDGSGVAHSPEGEAVFIPGTAPGDEAQVRIVKDCGRYAFGILDKLLTPSPDRIPVDCAVAGPCGGCSLRHMDYAAELRSKQESVADAFRRIGGLDVPVLDALPSPEVDRYRNKVQFPVGRDKNGAPCIGFYAGRTHRIVPCPDCKLQPGVLNDIGNALCSFFAAHGIQPYDEESGKGLVRHIFLRRGYTQRPDHGLPRLHPPEVSPQRGSSWPRCGSSSAILRPSSSTSTPRRPMSSWVKRPSRSTARATSRILFAVCRSDSAPSPSIRSTHWPLSGSTASLPSMPSWNPRTFCSTSTAAWVPSVSPWPTAAGAHRRGDRA